MRNFLVLLGIKLSVSIKNFIEFIRVIYRFYRNKSFARVDLYLLRNYILQSPYSLAKNFLIEKGEKEIYTYGETPLTTLEALAEKSNIQPTDIVYELGSGRGRGCFWLHFFVGCRVVGVEYVPAFVHIAQKTCREFKIDRVKFIHKDILETDFSSATVIYYYGTCSDTTFILQLIEKFKSLKKGTKFITISYPLTTYSTEHLFDVTQTFPVLFTWGETTAYIQIKK